jgi:signal transduction histidine kinase
MNISKKLMIIVMLTVVEVSITIFSAFEIAKGARFHQLNFLHLKYINQLTKSVKTIKKDAFVDIDRIKLDVLAIKQQPIDCLQEINVLNKMIMEIIGTHQVVTICERDIEVADEVLASIVRYQREDIEYQQFLVGLNDALYKFNVHSELFEEPIRKTVSFILLTLIPLVLIISLFNIILISYLSRTISSSIHNLTTLLSSKAERDIDLDADLEKNTTSELRALIIAARQRIKSDFLNLENNLELQDIVNTQTASLQQANDELAQFAYRASHDLKSPLSGAKSLAKFVIKDIEAGDFDEASNNANIIYQQMEKLENLVVDILLLAKADIGSEDVNTIDFEQLIVDMEERLAWLMKGNPCVLETSILLSRSVISEKARFAQVIENMVSNSFKYYDKNKKSSYVKCSIFDTNDELIIIVEDNGIGIPEKHHHEVFDMFKRFHIETSVGSGLGMALVKKHIDYLKGIILLESSAKGTTFKITLPMDNLS